MPLNQEQILQRINMLLSQGATGNEKMTGALTLTTLVYGPNHPAVKDLADKSVNLGTRWSGEGLNKVLTPVAEGALNNLRAELISGLIVNLQNEIAGEVFSDFLELAKSVLSEKSDEATNVAAVLTAALFEDTIRRLAIQNGVPKTDKLQDVLIELKKLSVLKGTQLSIANGYLTFRNKALHAQWDQLDRASVMSAIGFVEELLLQYFS